ncbi:hypothetical protein BDE02_08G137500 [Populus trichocarpa]|nr:hypothetical protein BDE02_08G137500 [Populus trichocarpa]
MRGRGREQPRIWHSNQQNRVIAHSLLILQKHGNMVQLLNLSPDCKTGDCLKTPRIL